MNNLTTLLTFYIVFACATVSAQETDDITKILNEGTQLQLQDLVIHNSDPNIRQVAMEKIKSESILKYVAYSDTCVKLRMLAVLRINTPITLKEVAMRDECAIVRKLALARIRCQYSIKQIALNNSMPTVRKMAVSLLTSKEDIIHFAINDTNKSVRNMADKKLNLMNKSNYLSKAEVVFW